MMRLGIDGVYVCGKEVGRIHRLGATLHSRWLSEKVLRLLSPRPKSNILLITFDALTAEDMSAFGYKLPTTPNIDAFAAEASVFTNFYSASTFTTPCIATMLTGLYPSQTHVHQLQGRLNDAEKSLPHILRAALRHHSSLTHTRTISRRALQLSTIFSPCRHSRKVWFSVCGI